MISEHFPVTIKELGRAVAAFERARSTCSYN